MNLAFLGFAMIIVFMALIMAKKLSPFTSLILVPVAWVFLASIKENSEFYGNPWALPAGFRGLYLRDDDLRDPILRRHADSWHVRSHGGPCGRMV